jgi:ribosome assembly protein YihI (activator of Der GTPase)
MPSTSDKQRRFMAAAAHDPKIAKRAGIPQSVAREFNRADKGKKLAAAMKRMPKRDNA